MDDFDFDLFVIGAGSGGVRACRVAAGLGARVAVAEERHFGGTCVNVGCVPKKLYSYAAHCRDEIQDSRGFGWRCPEPDFDWRILKNNKDKEIKRLEGIYQTILKENRVAVFKARARLAGPRAVEVEGRKVTARHILLAVGGWPRVPDFEGSGHAITSNEVFELEERPGSVAILGGGYIAVEFASIFARLGVRTALVYRRDLLLRGFDEDLRRFITERMARHLDLRLEDDAAFIAPGGEGLTLALKSGEQIACEKVLAATGRRPQTGDLGLDTVNVELSASGGIVVGEDFQTTEPGVYAVGDAIERVALTPVALAEAQIVAKRLFSGETGSMRYENIPTTVFCHPNLGSCGLSEQDAAARGMDIEVYSASVKQLKHALSGRDEPAFLKLVVERGSDRVVGLHMAGPDAGELVQGFAVAMNCGATKAQFDATVGIHPTLAEEFVTMRAPRGDGRPRSGN